MKILFVTQGYYPTLGGTEALIQSLSEPLVQDYHDSVTVFTTNCYGGDAFHQPDAPVIEPAEVEINGVQVRRFPVRRWISKLFHLPQAAAFLLNLPFNEVMRLIYQGPLMKGLKQALLSQPADVFVAGSFPLMHMFVTQKAGKKSGRPVVLIGALHPLDVWGYQRKMIYSTIAAADHYIALSEFEADYLVSRGISADTITTIGVGINPEKFSVLGTQAAKQRLGIGNRPVVGFIGQIAPHKGVGDLVKAMELVWQHQPEAVLLIAGAKRQYAQKVEQIIAGWSKDRQDQVLFKYNFEEDEKPLLFNAVDVFAYPSAFESFGIAYLEAWCARKPVIGTWEGAIPSIVSAGKDGLLVDYNKPKQLAEALITLLNKPDYAHQLGQCGYRKVLQKYTWEIVTARYRQVFKQFVG